MLRRHNAAAGHTAHHITAHRGYVSWSGGRDSTVVVDLARRADPTIPVVWFNSGLEFPDTGPYITRLAERWNLNLHVIDADPDALSIMAAAGSWDHSRPANWDAPDLHHALITEPARKARARFGHAELWGLRAYESKARRALLTPHAGQITRADGTVAYSPIWDWHDIDVDAYLHRHDIPEHPAYTLLRRAGATKRDLRVGLAVDGNNLHHGRVVWLRRIYPDEYARIEKVLPRIREWV